MPKLEQVYTLFGIYSCIRDAQRLHCVVANEKEAIDGMMEYVHLLTFHETLVFDEKTVFPVITYKVSDNNLVELFEHRKVEKIEKGWVWNGKKSEIESVKIGYFQMMPVENTFTVSINLPETQPDLPKLEPVETLFECTDKKNYEDEVDKLINEIVDNICSMKLEDFCDLEETNKKLKTDNNNIFPLNSNFESMFVPFYQEIKNDMENDEKSVESIRDLSPAPISRLSSRGGLKSKRRQPSPRRISY